MGVKVSWCHGNTRRDRERLHLTPVMVRFSFSLSLKFLVFLSPSLFPGISAFSLYMTKKATLKLTKRPKRM